jgi:hypothetical protein
VSRVWRKIKGDWDAWNKRDLSTEDIIRLILDGTVVRARIDGKATTISLLIVLGTARKFCLPSAAWAERAKRLGVQCSTTWSRAV